MDINEVLDSLRVIKRVCKESLDCRSCPFRKTGEYSVECYLRETTPVDWEIIEEEEAWRAFR